MNNTEVSIYEKMNDSDRKKVDEIAETINVEDTSAVLQYGNLAQSNVSNFSDNILKKVSAKDSGYVGEVLSNLMNEVKQLDADQLNKKGLLGFMSSGKRNVERFMAKYEKLSVQLDKTINELDKSKMQLLKDVDLLDELYQENLSYHRELEYYIAAGERKINELKETVLPKLTEDAQVSGDPLAAQKVKDYSQMLNRFEKKVNDLKLSKTIALQTGPQVRLIQSSDQVLVEKIQSSILNTIPLWKNQIVIAISLFRQDKALKQQQEVTKTTNDMLKKNSEMLKENTIEVAKESEKGIVEIETLKKVNQDLIDTIEETLNIQREGSAKRAQAEEELRVMEAQLKEKLISASN